MIWTQKQIDELKRYISDGHLFKKEIAEKMGLNVGAVRHKAKRLGLRSKKNNRMGKWNCKHQHLKKGAMTYFLNHSFEDTAEKFGLTQSEMKSLFCNGYKDPALAHLRKDTRRKDPWTLKEMLFLIRHAGIREREWIAQKLNRAKARCIKERVRSWNASTRHINGLPLSWALQIWPKDSFNKKIPTQAGPSGKTGMRRYQLLPWHECLRLSKKYDTPEHLKAGIRAMVKFQEFIYQTQSSSAIRRKIRKCLND